MSEEEKNNFVPLMDLITTNDISQSKQEKIIDINEISETNNAETLDEDDSKEKLNSDYNINLLDDEAIFLDQCNILKSCLLILLCKK